MCEKCIYLNPDYYQFCLLYPIFIILREKYLLQPFVYILSVIAREPQIHIRTAVTLIFNQNKYRGYNNIILSKLVLNI